MAERVSNLKKVFYIIISENNEITNRFNKKKQEDVIMKKKIRITIAIGMAFTMLMGSVTAFAA